MTEHRPALSYVIANYQNPTGSVLPRLAARRLVAAAADLGLPLVDDEVLADLTLSGNVPQPLAAFGKVISVGSLSKVVWGGLRIGWIRGSVPLISRLARLKAIHDLGTDVPAQLVAAALLPGLDTLRTARSSCCDRATTIYGPSSPNGCPRGPALPLSAARRCGYGSRTATEPRSPRSPCGTASTTSAALNAIVV